MASWEVNLKQMYEKRRATFVSLSDSTEKEDGNEPVDSDFKKESLLDESVEDQAMPNDSAEASSSLTSGDQSDMDDRDCSLPPHSSQLGQSVKSLDNQHQSFNKDMLCTVVKDMELSSKSNDNDFTMILEDLSEDNIDVKCISVLNFAKKCLAKEFYSQLEEADVLSLMLTALPKILSYNEFAFCSSVLLCVMSKYSQTNNEKRLMEKILIKFLSISTSRKKSEAFSMSVNDNGGFGMKSLPENVMEKSHELCTLMSMCDDWELQEMNITLLNCVAVKNIFVYSSKVSRRCDSDIICCMMDKIQEGVQQLSLKKQPCFAELPDCNNNLRVIWKCLQALEQASFLHPENQIFLVCCQDSALSRNGNRLLGFCMKYLFYDALPQSLDDQIPEVDLNCQKEVQFYLRSCLVSILKVLLNISHKCKEAVIKLGGIDGLMEKILMCILSIACPKSEEQFEISILCLELLINLIEPCWPNRKTFAILCLKKFSGPSDGKVYAVEHLIEILADTLKDISLLEQLKDEATQEADEESPQPEENVETAQNEKADIVFKAAGKHMEKSMVCAYISILLGFFVDIKKTFRDLVYDKMPRQAVDQAVEVSKNFLHFVALTEGANQNSVSSLNVMLNTLKSFHNGR